MKLRTKFIIFFGAFLFAIALGISFYAEYVVGNVFKEQSANNLRIIAEQSASAYLSFLGSMKVRVLDWTSDNTLREISKAILSAKEGSKERALRAKEFETYVSKKKMPYDKTIFLTDLLDKDGIVIASTRPERIGKNERDEEFTHRKAHDFDSTINSKFGEVFFGTIILDGDDYPDPTLNITVRLFDIDKDEKLQPLPAILLVYYSNVKEIANVLGSGTSVYAGIPAVTGRQTGNALLEGYRTSDIYLVNSEYYMVTPSRTIKDVRVKQKVETFPVRECLENGKEISAEYDNYQGVRVLGASMCFQKEGIVVLVEIQKDEIFAPLTALIMSTAIGGMVVFILGVLTIFFFIKKPFARINNVVLVAKQVEKGNLNVSIEVQTKDELGYLAASFNTMISAVNKNQGFLREGKARNEALLASLGEGMIATDKSGNIIAINRMAEKMLGLSSPDVIGEKAVDIIEVLDENEKEISREQRSLFHTVATPSTTSSTMLYRKKKDGYFPVAVTVTPVILEGKIVGSIEIFRDITKEKEMEKTRGDLLSLASHQLRTPLSGTKWLIETLRNGLKGPLSVGQREYIDEIYRVNERMTSLVHDMLEVLRMEGDNTQIKNESVSIKVLLSTMFETLHGVAESKKISIIVPENADFAINTDPLLLRNVLEGLVSNAINYSESGREVVISVEKKDSELVFAVKDSGIGIPKNEQRQIFERFYRASNAKTFDTRGSGLGLYIVATFAKKIGAKLSFESEVGKGSTFFVYLPYTIPH